MGKIIAIALTVFLFVLMVRKCVFFVSLCTCAIELPFVLCRPLAKEKVSFGRGLFLSAGATWLTWKGESQREEWPGGGEKHASCSTTTEYILHIIMHGEKCKRMLHIWPILFSYVQLEMLLRHLL